jgi:hypothetical protein
MHQASPRPCWWQWKDSGVDSANVVPEKRPRKKNVSYTPDNWFGCVYLLRHDGNLWTYFVSLLWTYVWMDAILWWKIATLWWNDLSLWIYVWMLVLNMWLCGLVLCEYVIVWTCSGYIQLGPECWQHSGCSLSRARRSGVTNIGVTVTPKGLARIGSGFQCKRRVRCDLVALDHLAQLRNPRPGLVAPDGLAWLSLHGFNIPWLQTLLQNHQGSSLDKK